MKASIVVCASAVVVLASTVVGQEYGMSTSPAPSSFDYLRILQNGQGGYYTSYLPALEQFDSERRAEGEIRTLERDISQSRPYYLSPRPNSAARPFSFLTPTVPTATLPARRASRFLDYGHYYPTLNESSR